MQRRNFLKNTAVTLAASGYLGSDWLQALTTGNETDGHKTGHRSSLSASQRPAREIDLKDAVVVTRPGQLPNAERTAAVILTSELAKRTGIHLRSSTSWPKYKTVIAITSETEVSAWGRAVPMREDGDRPERRPDGYRIYVETGHGAPPVIWILGGDARGTLFGVGNLLRKLDWEQGEIRVSSSLDLATAPVYPIRGHQLGYRAQANSYDAWDASQFEQYIRELTFFGVNSIEGIPFQDTRETPVLKFPRRQMNRDIGEICNRYGLDYWAWLPAEFDLKDTGLRAKLLEQSEQFFRDTPTFTAVSFPGGDPGDNSPELVLPFLSDLAKRMLPIHPKAKVWLSLQHFDSKEVDAVYAYLDQNSPEWFGGLVAGPGSPPLAEMRSRLAKQYGLRLYPDLTHNKLSQYEVRDWDQAFALTEGREAVNPRAVEYAQIFEQRAGYGDGFISYSDGVHDDVNKTVWSALSWDPTQSVTEILIDYSRAYFHPVVSKESADSIFALEKNWRGPLLTNGSVEGTLMQWQRLEKRVPQLEGNWRWQMCLLRANYDAYIRHRLIHETGLELEANAILADSSKLGSDAAMTQAMAVLNLAVKQPVNPDLRARIFDLCEKLFHSIGLQTSVPKYYAINEQRGAVLDFVDYPLNNRWWLEDEFVKIRALNSEDAKVHRLYDLATWEHPGPGSFYDDVGNLDKSPHVVRCVPDIGRPSLVRESGPTFWWWDEGKSRARLTWQVTMWPIAVVYEALDPNATYVVRSTGYGQALLRINGERVQSTISGEKMGDFMEFPVASKYLQERKLVLTWDKPMHEQNLNWRNQSRLSEVWLLKK